MINFDDLEMFTGKRRRVLNKRHEAKLNFVSISKNHVISFSTYFSKNADINQKEDQYCRLYYSKKNKAILFYFLNFKPHDNASYYKISKTKTKWNTVSLASFLNTYGLNKYSGKYEPKKQFIENIGDCWVIFLKKPLKELNKET